MSNDNDTQKAYTKSQYMSVEEIAQVLGVSRMTVYRLIKDGELPTLTVGKKSYRVPREEFEAWRRANTTGTRLMTERQRVTGEVDET